MNKPEHIEQWAWDKARAAIANQCAHESLSECIAAVREGKDT